MILVTCERSDSGIEKGSPCAFITAVRVVPEVSVTNMAEETKFETVEWCYPKDDDLDNFPGGKPVGLFPIQHPEEASLIVEDCRVARVYGGPVVFVFCVFDASLDCSKFVGNTYAVKVI
jgi:hypothetical protein